jgi:CRP-like cAMP-binding protein
MNISMNFINKLLLFAQQEITPKTIKKGTILLKNGEVEQNLYLVHEGALRVVFISEEEEMTIRFGYKGSLINSLSSFFNGTKSEFQIEAIRKTSISIIPKAIINSIISHDEQSRQEYIALLESLITQQTEREIDLLTVSPQERLERILQRSPNLFQEVPLKYIASYLRMSPETLSRIRKS